SWTACSWSSTGRCTRRCTTRARPLSWSRCPAHVRLRWRTPPREDRMLTRADLDTLPAYVPGKSVPGSIKLASNEVPFGPLPGVVEATPEAAASTHRYPDMGVVALRDALAQRLGVAEDRVATGCGSVALAEHLAKATCHDGDEILYSWRSFEAYPIIAATA